MNEISAWWSQSPCGLGRHCLWLVVSGEEIWKIWFKIASLREEVRNYTYAFHTELLM
jgi:hypothetical protein